MIDKKKLFEALNTIQGHCAEMNGRCEDCPLRIDENSPACGVTVLEPDNWDLNYPGDWRAFK